MRKPVALTVATAAGLIAACAVLIFGRGETTGPTQSDQQSKAEHAWHTGRLATADPGVTVEHAAHPRVVALAPGIAQMLRDLRCGRLIVGRHESDRWTDPTVPICGDQRGIDYERLIAANPTHVLLQWGSRDLPERLVALAAERKWTLIDLKLVTLTDINLAVVRIQDEVVRQELAAQKWDHAAVTDPGAPSPAPPVDDELHSVVFKLFERFDAAMRTDPALARAGRVMLLYQSPGETAGTGRPTVLGPGSYNHDVLIRIGGQTATPEGKPFLPLDVEDVARLSPDAIVIVRPRAPGTQPATPTDQELLLSLGAIARLDIPAVKNRRVALIDDEMALIPGTNLISVADRTRQILRAWADAPAAPR